MIMMELSNQQLTLGRMIELSDLMLQAAQNQDWEAVMQMQKLRDEFIYSFFEQKLLIDSTRLADDISYILSADKDIESLAKDESHQLQRQLKKLAQGKTAVKAYSNI